MKTGGKPGFSNLDEYFSAMDKIIKEKKTSSRVRFLMQVLNRQSLLLSNKYNGVLFSIRMLLNFVWPNG